MRKAPRICRLGSLACLRDYEVCAPTMKTSLETQGPTLFHSPSRTHLPALLIGLVMMAIVAAGVSLVRSGFAFGISNNVFHIPLVLDWASLPAFAGDAYYQSLGKFTSIVWPLVRAVATEANVETVFLAAHALSRFAAMFAIGALMVIQLRLRPAQALVACLAVALTPWMHGSSLVGGHGLFIHYFTHSEVTWGFLLLALMAAHAGRWSWAAALAGLVFGINAFIGIWLLVMLLAAYATATPRRAGRQLLIAGLVFLLCTAPVLWWIAQSMGTTYPAFSFKNYIRAYFPNHFLIESASMRDVLILGMLLGVGCTAALLLPRRAFWLAVLLAPAGLFMVGTALPYLLNHRVVFNLHLLRVDGVIQWLAIVLAVAALVPRLGTRASRATRIYAVVALVSLLTPVIEPTSLMAAWVALAALAWMECRHAEKRLSPLLNRPVFAIEFMLLVLAMELARHQLGWAYGARWAAMLAFTVGVPAGGANLVWPGLGLLLLLPKIEQRGAVLHANPFAPPLLQLSQWIRQEGVLGPLLIEIGPDLDSLQVLTRVPVWVDWKQGAAVMWEPAFHQRWSTRYHEVRALQQPSEFVAYARQHGIRYIVLRRSRGDCSEGSEMLYRNASYQLCRLS